MKHCRYLFFVGLIVAAGASRAARSAEAPLGSAKFLPTPDNAVGWRGDGSGRYPGATPPKQWHVQLTNAPGLASSASKPKGDPKIDTAPDMALDSWIAIGSWTVGADVKAALDTAYLADEMTVEPSEGDKAGDKKWKKLPTHNGAVNLADVFGEAPRDPKQPAWEAPKQLRVIYAVTYVYSPNGGAATLYWTHGNGGRIYLNGQAAGKRDGGLYDGQPGGAQISLKPGWNRLMLKSCGAQRGPAESAWAFGAWLQMLPAKGTAFTYESKNIIYAASLPGSSVTSPIVVGDKLFVTGEHWLAALRKKDGQLLWYRTIIPYEGHAKDAADAEGVPAKVDQFNAACRKMHELDDQYVSQFKDGKIPATLESQRKQALDELTDLLRDLDEKRARTIKAAWQQGEPGGALTPCSDGKYVYAWSQLAVAVCYDLEGKQHWIATVPRAGDAHHGYSASPVIVDGKLVCSQETIWAFDLKTGATAWSTKRSSSWGSLIRARSGDEPVLVEQGNVIHGAKDGNLFRGDEGGKDRGQFCCSTSIPVEGSRVLGSFGNASLVDLVDLSGSVRHSIVPWPTSPLSGGLYSDWPIASPLYHDGYAYIITQGGTLMTADLKAMKVASVEKLDTRVCFTGTTVGGRAGITASPCFAGGLLYFFDDSGNTIVRQPGPNGKVVARNSLVQSELNYQGRLNSTNSTPVFDAERIYWRIGNRLYCIGER